MIKQILVYAAVYVIGYLMGWFERHRKETW